VVLFWLPSLNKTHHHRGRNKEVIEHGTLSIPSSQPKLASNCRVSKIWLHWVASQFFNFQVSNGVSSIPIQQLAHTRMSQMRTFWSFSHPNYSNLQNYPTSKCQCFNFWRFGWLSKSTNNLPLHYCFCAELRGGATFTKNGHLTSTLWEGKVQKTIDQVLELKLLQPKGFLLS
jgi:hypothetical protein